MQRREKCKWIPPDDCGSFRIQFAHSRVLLMNLSVDGFVGRLVGSGLMTADEVRAFRASLPAEQQTDDGQEFARVLVQQNKLTAYQATAIYQGKASSLILGSYVILDKVGQGGMGMVFKARHRMMRRLVAIKVLPTAALASPERVERFRREVEMAAQLVHPNIVTAFDAGESNRVHFLVMEFVEGGDLEKIVRHQGALPIEQAVQCILQAARGLEAAHQAGVIHRDIKPSNLLLDKDGVVKVLDMGLARVEQGDPDRPVMDLTATGTIMGTVDYMAPEQALNTKRADARADIYSLGISLYMLVTGRVPYRGDTAMEKLLAHREQPIPPLVPPGEKRDPRAAGTERLDAIFRQMVAKEPADRYQTMTEVIRDLESSVSAAKTTSGLQQFAVVPKSDSALESFLRNQPDPTIGEPLQHAASGSKTERRVSPLQSIYATVFAPPSSPAGRRRRNFVVTGIVSAVVLVGTVVMFLMNSSGPRTAESNKTSVPSVATQPSGQKAAASKIVATAASSAQPTGPSPPVARAPFDAAQAKAHQETWARHLGTTVKTTNSIGMKLVLLPPGEFLMGSTDEQVDAAVQVATDLKEPAHVQAQIRNSERPQHRVALTKPFLCGETEVTKEQFRRFVESSGYVTDAEKWLRDNQNTQGKRTWRDSDDLEDRPATNVTWNDAAAFCNWLSEQEQLPNSYLRAGQSWSVATAQSDGYRLPTEAEWEYACRAGTTTQFSFGDNTDRLDAYAWHVRSSGGVTHAVATKLPNPFGLYDMHGNVMEWCQDWYDEKWYENSSIDDPQGPFSGFQHVLRGGNRPGASSQQRSAYRECIVPTHWYVGYGFRIVRGIRAAEAASHTEPQPKTTVSPPRAKAPFSAAQAKAHQEVWARHLGTTVETTNGIGMKLMLLPPGEFLMGSTDEEIDAALKAAADLNIPAVEQERIRNSERPQHRVVLTKPFLCGATEVTIGQFRKFVEATNYITQMEGWLRANENNEEIKGKIVWRETGKPDDFPVGSVTWNDAAAFCNWLSKQEHLPLCYLRNGQSWSIAPAQPDGYRLPQEAEWEYACRAGTTEQYPCGNDVACLADYAWYGKNSLGQMHSVGKKLPNPFGLFDLQGNRTEWCQDLYDDKWYKNSPTDDPQGPLSGDQRVIRGGGWVGTLLQVRSAHRQSSQSFIATNGGFRIVRGIGTAVSKPQVTPSPAPPLATAPFDAPEAKAYQDAWATHLGATVETTNSIGMKLVLLPPGEFRMGSPDEQIEAVVKWATAQGAPAAELDAKRSNLRNSEQPVHQVIISKPFFCSATEVTVGQFRKFVEATKLVTFAEEWVPVQKAENLTEQTKLTWHGLDDPDDWPVAAITWYEAVAFCNWLSEQEKLPVCYRRAGQRWEIIPQQVGGYRLPTEAEWEYACRAGTTTIYPFGENANLLFNYAWFALNAWENMRTRRAVATKLPNAFGLHDMLGNVPEWCQDRYAEKAYSTSTVTDPQGPGTGEQHVIRGGVVYTTSSTARSAARHSASLWHAAYGFRVVRNIEPSAAAPTAVTPP